MEQAVQEITDVVGGVTNELEVLGEDLKDEPDLYVLLSQALAFINAGKAKLAILGVELTPRGRPQPL